MPDLDSGTPTPGPSTPTRDAQPVLAIPAPLVPTQDLDLSSLSPEELQGQLLARERDMKFRLAAIRHEVSALGDDVSLGGRPVLDIIRDKKELAIAAAAGVGALVGVLLALRARAKRRPEHDDELEFVRARLSTLLDEAAYRVAMGKSSAEDALRHTLKTTPVIYTERQPVEAAAKSSLGQTTDVLVKAVVGFAAKAAADLITQRVTGHEHVGDALADA